MPKKLLSNLVRKAVRRRLKKQRVKTMTDFPPHDKFGRSKEAFHSKVAARAGKTAERVEKKLKSFGEKTEAQRRKAKQGKPDFKSVPEIEKAVDLQMARDKAAAALRRAKEPPPPVEEMGKRMRRMKKKGN